MTSIFSSSRPVTFDDVETKHLGHLLSVVRQRMIADLDAAGASIGLQLGQGPLAGLRPSQLRLLSLLPRDGARLTDLTGVAGMTKQGLGQYMDELQELGYVSSTQHPADRRTRILARTPAGDAAVAATNQVYEALEAGWAGEVGERRWATFRSVLAQLAVLEVTDPV